LRRRSCWPRSFSGHIPTFEIYRKPVEKLFEARGRENYRESCGHLLRIRELYRN